MTDDEIIASLHGMVDQLKPWLMLYRPSDNKTAIGLPTLCLRVARKDGALIELVVGVREPDDIAVGVDRAYESPGSLNDE